jgi:hypothetical protein
MKDGWTRLRPFPFRESWIRASPFSSVASARKAEYLYRTAGGQKAIGFTATSSLKSMGRIPRSTGWYAVGEKYRNIR